MHAFQAANPAANRGDLARECGRFYEQAVRDWLRTCGYGIVAENVHVMRDGCRYTAHDGQFDPTTTVNGGRVHLEIKYSIHPDERRRVHDQLLRQLLAFPGHRIIVFCEKQGDIEAMREFFLASPDGTAEQKASVSFVSSYQEIAGIVEPHQLPMDDE